MRKARVRRLLRSRTQGLERLEARELLAGDLVAHWLAQDLIDSVNDGDAVNRWVDRVNQAPAEAAGTPQLASQAVGGRAAIQFDPSDGLDLLRVESDNNPLAGATDFSMAVVFATTSSSFQDGPNWYSQTGLVDANQLGFATDWGLSIDSGAALTAGVTNGFGSTAVQVESEGAALNDGAAHLAVVTKSGDQLSLYVDDRAVVTAGGASTAPRDGFSDLVFGALQTSAGGFTGEIAEVRVFNGGLTSTEVATLRNEITAFYNNLPPVAQSDTYMIAEDGLLFVNAANGVLSNDSDPDGDPLTAEIVETTANGTLGFSEDGSFIYSPTANFFGTDTFTYAAKDFRPSVPVQVTINVTPQYDAVVTNADSYKGLPTEVLQVPSASGVLANDVNIDQSTLTTSVATPPANGQINLQADGSFTYDPEGFAGVATFEYQVNDGTTMSAPETVTLIINTPPQATADNYQTNEDTPLLISVGQGVLNNDNDADGNAMTVELIDGVQNGTLSLADDGSFTYTPTADYFGNDSFTYRVADSVDPGNTVLVSLTVSAVNDPPVGAQDVYFGVEGESLMVDVASGLLANDSDVDNTSLSVSLVEGPQNGTLTLRPDGSLTYAPNADFAGADGFRYQVSDGAATSTPVQVDLFIGTTPIKISEIMAANVDGLETRVRESADTNFRGVPEYPDWIELQNLSQGDFDLSGYHLTDSEIDSMQWTFPDGAIVPAGGYLVVYGGDIAVQDPALDETGRYHTNFKLNLNGEYLALTDPAGVFLDGFADGYPDQVPNVSYGQTINGQLAYLRSPTPGAANSDAYLGQVADTRFSMDRGFYNDPFQVEITTASVGAEIRYTFDGTVPSPSNGFVYSSPITIDRTTTLRAAAFQDGYLTPDIDTQTYLFVDDVIAQAAAPVTGPTSATVTYPDRWRSNPADYEMDPEITESDTYRDRMTDAILALPSLSLTMPQDAIFGQNGLYSVPSSTSEEATSAELIFPDGTRGFQIDAGARMQGGASRNLEHKKHSMSLRFREDYGESTLDFPLFENSPVTEFDSIHLRARYNNSWIHWDQGQRNRGSMIREAWMRDSMLAAGEVAAGHGRYVHLYLNGLYWGVYEMHERQDASHYANYFGGDAYQYDATNAGAVVDGTIDSWSNLRSVVNSREWDQIQQVLDVDNHIRYTIMNQFGGNQDLKGDGNWRTAGGGLADAPWQFYVWDAERVLENVNQRGTSPVSDLLGFLARLDDIDEYMIRFADITHELFFNEGALTPTQTAARWMKRANELDVAIVAESARWGDLKQTRPLTRDVEWINEQQRVLTYFEDRTANVLNQFRGRYYPDTDAAEFLVDGQRQHGGIVATDAVLTLTNPNANGGTVYYTLDGSDPRMVGGAINPDALIYNGAPISVDGLAHIRARVWSGEEWSAITDATFSTSVPADATNLSIVEINYHPRNADPARGEMNVDDREFEFLELQNISQVPINLGGVQFQQSAVDGNAEGIIYHFEPSILAPGERTLVVHNRDAFLSRYPDANGSPHPFAPGSDGLGGPVGQWTGGSLGDGGELLTLVDQSGTLIQQFAYDDRGNWSERADGVGSTLMRVDMLMDPSDGASWRASWTIDGTPSLTNDETAPTVVINEVLSNSNAPVVDQIELYNTGSQTVDVSHWFLSDSRNNLTDYQLPAGTSIAPGAYLVLSQNDFGFGLKGQDADDVWLSQGNAAGDLVAFVDNVDFDATEPNVSVGRWPNGTGRLFPQSQTSFGSANTGPLLSPVVISEIHYNAGLANDGSTDEVLEFVEVWNTSQQPVSIDGWELDRGVEFSFGAGTTLGPNQGLVVVSFDPASDAVATNHFRTTHGIADQVALVGPYDGTLDNGGENLELLRPLAGSDGRVLVDQVRYDDVAPWPMSADGTGHSLHRVAATSYGDFAASWTATPPSPGSARFTGGPDYDLNDDGVVNVLDVDLACAAIQAENPEFDFNGDQKIDAEDLYTMLASALQTTPGDANLDGVFNSTDLVLVFTMGEYEDTLVGNSTWADGDWNCDGEFGTSDLVAAFQAGGYTSAARTAAIDQVFASDRW